MRFALPFGLLFLAVAAFALSRLVANDLNRAAHRSRRMPGTSFEPDIDIDDENDNAQFESALKSLRTSDSPRVRRQLRLYRGLQVAGALLIAAAFITTPR